MTKKTIILLALLSTSQWLIAQIMVETISPSFNASGGLTLGPDGLLYCADFGASLDNANGTQVWKIDFKNGGQPQLFANGLSGASGNDFDSEGNLFQSSISAGTVSKISPEGAVSLFSNRVTCNVGVNIDAEDNLYICNCCGANGNTIGKLTKGGLYSTFSSSNLLFCPNGITRDKNNNLYVSNFSNGNVVKITPQGQASVLAVTPGKPGVSGPSNGHITYSEKENVLYVASHGSHKIYKLTLSGSLSVLAGSGQRGNQDGTALEASFSRPNGLALSISEDTLFVNSSVPTTDVGGRPLNPSLIRMISGLRPTISNQREEEPLNLNIYYDSASHSIVLKGEIDSSLDFHLIDLKGKILLNDKIDMLQGRINFPLGVNLMDGGYVAQFVSEDGRIFTQLLAIVK